MAVTLTAAGPGFWLEVTDESPDKLADSSLCRLDFCAVIVAEARHRKEDRVRLAL